MAKVPFKIDIGLIAGNSTANLVANSTQLTLANSTQSVTLFQDRIDISGVVNLHSSGLSVGSVSVNATTIATQNVQLGVSDISIGNSTVNTVANSSVIRTSSVNATSNISVGSTTLNTVAVSTGNVAANNIAANNVSGNGANLTSTKWLGASYTISTGDPSGGSDGDFWFKRDA